MKSRRAPQPRQRIAMLLPQSLMATVENIAAHYDAERAATMRLLLVRGVDAALRELPAPLLNAVLATARQSEAGNAPAPSGPPIPVNDR